MTGNRVGVKIKYLQATTRVEKFAFLYIKKVFVRLLENF